MSVVARLLLVVTLAPGAFAQDEAPSRAGTDDRPAPAPAATPLPPGSAGEPSRPARGAAPPSIRLGALLPLSGHGVWYGQEMRQGMELAATHASPAPARPARPAPAPTGAGGEGSHPRDPVTAAPPDPSSPPADDGALPRTEAPVVEMPPLDPARPALQVTIEFVDVPPAETRDATTAFGRLAASGALAILTASPTPTLTVHPLAAARDMLLFHQGLPSDRFPIQSRILVQLRPGAAARAEAVAREAWGRGVRRLALLASGDDFGKAARAALSARWRTFGAVPVLEESVSLDSPDLAARLRALARLAPEAVCLAVRGGDLGELARRLRAAGYGGALVGLDDDRAALLAAGPIDDLFLVADAFVPVPGSRGARFAAIYEAKHRTRPSRFAAAAYDAVTLLAEAARGALEEDRRLPSPGRLRERVRARREVPSVFEGPIVVQDDGTVARPLALFRVTAGRPAFLGYLAPGGTPAAWAPPPPAPATASAR